jgi:hypothetical protein
MGALVTLISGATNLAAVLASALAALELEVEFGSACSPLPLPLESELEPELCVLSPDCTALASKTALKTVSLEIG